LKKLSQEQQNKHTETERQRPADSAAKLSWHTSVTSLILYRPLSKFSLEKNSARRLCRLPCCQLLRVPQK